MDRAYVDFGQLYALHQVGAFLVTRVRSNFKFKRIGFSVADARQGRSAIGGSNRAHFTRSAPIPSGCVARFKDSKTGKSLVFLCNHFASLALSICTLYNSRWPIDLMTLSIIQSAYY
jgi:hypothetical protein